MFLCAALSSQYSRICTLAICVSKAQPLSPQFTGTVRLLRSLHDCTASWKPSGQRHWERIRLTSFVSQLPWPLFLVAWYPGSCKLGVCVCVFAWAHDPMDCSPPAFSVHRIFQAKILEQIATPDFQIQRSNSHLLCLLHWLVDFFTCTAWEAPCKPYWMKFWKYINTFVQLLRHVQLFVVPWTASCQASLFFIISWSLLKFMFIELVILSKHLILCWHLLLLPSIFPSIRIFYN